MKIYRIVGIFFLAIVVASCASSKMSALPINSESTHPVRAIAMAPAGGLLAEAVGIELSNLGYTLIDSATTTRLLVRLNMDEIEVATPQGLMKLKDKGIDAFLTVKAAGAYDGQVQSASTRASSTHNGKIIAGVSWQNGWGGRAGSIADRTMRKGFAEVAHEIAVSLSRSLPLQ